MHAIESVVQLFEYENLCFLLHPQAIMLTAEELCSACLSRVLPNWIRSPILPPFMSISSWVNQARI